jgi:hypothetical protein
MSTGDWSMKIKTLEKEIAQDVRYWIINFKDECSYLYNGGHSSKPLSMARAIDALEEKTVKAVNDLRESHGFGRIAIKCSVCKKEAESLVVVGVCLGEGEIQLCPDCLRAALAMYDQVKK